MFPEAGKHNWNNTWWSGIQVSDLAITVESELETINTADSLVDWPSAIAQGQTQMEDSLSDFQNTVRLRKMWLGLGRSPCHSLKRKACSALDETSEQSERRTRQRTSEDKIITALAPAHSALFLQRLPIRNILMMRQTCKYFVDACRSVYSLDLSELGLEWSAATIKQHLLPCFGTPLTLENVRSSRSMKLRDLHALVDSGELRIRSLTLGPNCHVGRVRAKRVAGLVTVGMLESLDMGGSGCLRSAGALSLSDSLTGSPRSLSSLQHLNLRACRIGVEGAVAVARLLASPECALLSLSLQDNALGSEGATAIARALAGGGAQRLQSLNLTLNHLRTEGAIVVAQALTCPTSLVNVNLSWNLIRSGAAEALAVAMTQGGLTTLDLGFNLIRCSGAAHLASALAECSTLQELSLRRNELAPEGATQLARALFTNTSLLSLDLGLNGIGPAGARLLGSALGRNDTLRHLDLDWNALRQQGIQHLAPGLRVNQGLTHLDLSCNKLLQDGAFALATALAGRHSERLGGEASFRPTILKGLLLRGNGIGPWGLRSLMPLLGKGDGELDVSDNSLGDSGCLLLANEGQALLMECSSLNLSGNAISSEGLEALIKVLLRSTKLQELKLARNNLSRLPATLVDLPALTVLSVHDNPLEDPPAHVLQGGYKAICAYLRRGQAYARKGRCACCGLVTCLGQGQRAVEEAKESGEQDMGAPEQDEGDVVMGVERMAGAGLGEGVLGRGRGRGGWSSVVLGAEELSDSHWEEEFGSAREAQEGLSDEELEASRAQHEEERSGRARPLLPGRG